MRPGVDPGFLVRGDDRGAKGRERGAVRREAPECRRDGMKSWSIILALGLFTLGALFQNNLGR